MRFVFHVLSLSCLLLPVSLASQAQQVVPAPSPAAAPVAAALSEDSVRVMSGLVQASVRQLRAIYYEPDDARATQLVEAALLQIPVYNQRLSAYTASLPREQQQQLAQRLRQQPWQVELQTLLRSPQYKEFNTRTARSPTLKAAADRLAATGFLGSSKPATAPVAGSAASAAKPAVAPKTVATAAPKTATAPAPAKSAAKPAATPAGAAVPAASAPKPAAALAGTAAASVPAKATEARAPRRHTVVKGETLFAIARQYGVKAAQLQAWNSKTDNSVKVGEVLTIHSVN